jgi:hypothetical protein
MLFRNFHRNQTENDRFWQTFNSCKMFENVPFFRNHIQSSQTMLILDFLARKSICYEKMHNFMLISNLLMPALINAQSKFTVMSKTP